MHVSVMVKPRTCRAGKKAQGKTPKAPAVGQTLMEKAESKKIGAAAQRAESPSGHPLWLRKCLSLNYKGIDPHLVTDFGMSLIQELETAKMAGVSMGKIYHEETRAKFAPPAEKAAVALIKDTSQKKDEKLDKALKQYFQHARKPALLETWLGTSPLTTQMNFAVLCMSVNKMGAAKSIDNAEMVMRFIQYCKRTNAHSTHPAEWASTFDVRDAAFRKTHSHMKNDGQGTKAWWSCMVDWGGDIVVPKAAMDVLCEIDSDWNDGKDQLREVEAALPCMSVVFAEGLEALRNASIADIVVEHAAPLRSQNLTVAGINDAWEKCAAALLAANIDPYDPVSGLVVKVWYRRQYGIEVDTLYQLWEFLVESIIRQTGIENGDLDPLFCEAELCPIPTPAVKYTIEPPLLVRALKVRKAASEMLPLAKAQTQANINDVFKKRFSTLRMYDKFVLIEKGFFDCYMDGGETSTVNAIILSKFSNIEGDLTMQTVLDDLTTLSNSKLMDFVGMSPKAALEQVRKWVGQLAKKAEPSFSDASPTALFLSVKQAMAKWLKAPNPQAADEGASKFLYGAEAVSIHIEEAKALPTSNKEEKNALYAKVSDVMRFDWLLKEAERTELLTLKKTALSGRNAAEKRTSPFASASSSSAGGARKKEKKDIGSVIVNAMYLQKQ